MKPLLDLSVYLVLGPQDCPGQDPVDIATAAATSGASVIQLRDKRGTTREQVQLAQRLMTALEPLNVPLIVNDRIDVALAVNADGVHVGQEDMDASKVRELIGPDKLLGLSVSTQSELDAADLEACDYLGIGACFPTISKDDAAQVGMQNFRHLTEQATLPVVGIGGISLANAAQVISAGADGVAVISAICGAPDVSAATKELSSIVAARKDLG
ncbi:Thiamine-phosphate synthase [Pseudovibrio axinellae]|uniref:Thiamine-phosphate synthase n=1 Tax=Pseudovibrio axinellae TaxID=989403 RepID=A0A166A0H0_9HYPH|nr:thiamine phosphate synthase [Pseudovibrio axinellae]KZL20489.1 Thiamine-phosphate synthase [Pseudovibrio axinellae]SEQ36941.1 thiamine-phosphate diphosphorylase [Pseudovibrio axinellae]